MLPHRGRVAVLNFGGVRAILQIVGYGVEREALQKFFVR